MVEKHAREVANEDHSESQPKLFKESIISLRWFGLEAPHTAESLEIWSSCPDGVCVPSSQQVAEVTKYVGCAVESAVEVCGEANLISEHRSNTIELQLCTQQICRAALFVSRWA